MKFANAIRFNRKSGEAEESAVSPSQYRMLMEESFCSLGAPRKPANGSVVLPPGGQARRPTLLSSLVRHPFTLRIACCQSLALHQVLQ